MQDAGEEEKVVNRALGHLCAHLLDSGVRFGELAAMADCEYRELYRILRRWGVYHPLRTNARIQSEDLLEAKFANRSLGHLCTHLLDSGVRFSELAVMAGTRYHDLYRILRRWDVYHPARSHKRIPPAQERLIFRLLLKTNLSRRQIAARVKVSKGSIDNRARRLRKRIVDRASDEVVFQEQCHKCPKHGLVAYTPCPACEAERAR